jgi:hypothetical protein
MVFYQCYRCGYSNNDKSKIRQHINRKKPCDDNLNNIDLDDCKKAILQGLRYEDYLKSVDSGESSVNPGKSSFQNTLKPQNNTLKPQNNTLKPQNNTLKPQNNTLKPQNDTLKPQNDTLIQKIECKYCDKLYSRTDSLNRHLKICKEKKQDDEVKESMTELVKLLNKKLEEKDKQLEKQNKQFEKQNKQFEKEISKRDNELEKQLTKQDKELEKRDKHIEELVKKAGINNSTINVQNNIKLLSYSDTDRSHLTDKDILKCLKHSNFCIPYLIKKVHFDENKPENHNVYISNLKNKYVMMYDGNKWECKDRDEQISNLMDDNEGVIEYKLEEWLEKGVKYPEMMKKFNTYIEKKDNNKVINIIKDEIKLLLYNNRNVVNKESSNKAIELIET